MIEQEWQFEFKVTTQGPIYPPSEILDEDGNFVVIGHFPRDGKLEWDAAIVDINTTQPVPGELHPYKELKKIKNMSEEEISKKVLFSLPLPLPCNNYPMLFAPEQCPDAHYEKRDSLPLHDGYINDYRESDGKRDIKPITLYSWMQAKGNMVVKRNKEKFHFEINCENLVPNSVYTIMSLRKHDFDINCPTRPGPLGIPNIMMTDKHGNGSYWAELSDPFLEGGNRIINVIVLYMSCRQSFGGAIGLYGLGGDIHAHLKLDYKDLTSIISE